MKKFYVILAAVAGITLTSCTSNEYLGDLDPTANQGEEGVIKFGLSLPGATRADIYGGAAATLLGNNFYVMGTKGTEEDDSPTTTLVFDNYLVHYNTNTAGTTESNTANWEYVGVVPGTAPTANYVKLSDLNIQTIKYWDYSANQYDFFGFSTGTFKPVDNTTPSSTEIGVTKMAYGASLKNKGIAYTFVLPSVDALKSTYITDITEVAQANYGKEVQLKFKNLGSKVRIALYETVPGYSVKDVVFYKVDGTTAFTDGDTDPTNDEDFKSPTATLISADNNGLPTNGTIQVYFPHVGNDNDGEEDYNKAAGTVTPGGSYDKYKGFGTLTAQLTGKDPNGYEDNTSPVYLGRSLPAATFAGSSAAAFYESVFPVSSSAPLTLRVDYTLVSIDGSAEEIKVYGAKAVVPSTYTKWLPNYAYTYIFKISDNTNGWTSPDASTDSSPAGLFPITFDAVVAEATDATGEQTTITTVAAPSITTYQQYHNKAKDEYSKSVKDLAGNDADRDVYVQVMDNSAVPATLKGDLNGDTPDATKKSLLYAITGTAPITEATVMDALENQTSVSGGVITGRNGMILTPNTNINAGVASIVNGVDDNPISVTAGQAAQIDMSEVAVGTYAYVYDYSDAAKVNTTIYQPITATGTLASGTKFVTTATLNGIDTSVAANVTTANEAVDDDYIYFSKTTNGGSTTTYSFVSVDGKTTLPAGLVKCPVGSLSTSTGSTDASAAAFVFTVYTRNTGKYAVKVIKVVS